jgi:hypothetical protein
LADPDHAAAGGRRRRAAPRSVTSAGRCSRSWWWCSSHWPRLCWGSASTPFRPVREVVGPRHSRRRGSRTARSARRPRQPALTVVTCVPPGQVPSEALHNKSDKSRWHLSKQRRVRVVKRCGG